MSVFYENNILPAHILYFCDACVMANLFEFERFNSMAFTIAKYSSRTFLFASYKHSVFVSNGKCNFF